MESLPGPNHTSPRTGSAVPEFIFDPLFDRFDIAFVIRKYLWRLMIAPVIAVALAVAVYATRQPLFESSTLILVDPRFDELIQVEKVGQGQPTDLDSLKSLEILLAGDSLILRVVDRLNLRESEGFLPKELTEVPELSDSQLVGFLKENRITATLLPETRLIKIAVLDPDPERARLIASAFSSEFEAFMAEERRNEVESSRVELEKQAQKARESALAAEQKLQEFREQHPEFPVEQDHDLFAARLTQFGDELNTATRQRVQLESQDSALTLIDHEKAPMDVLEVANYTGMSHVSDLLNALATARANFRVLEAQTTSSHPTYRTAAAELERREAQLRELAREIKAAIRTKYLEAQGREKLLTEKLESVKREFVEMKTLSSQFRARQQQVDREWLVHETLQQRLSDSALATELNGSISTVVSAALKPHKKAKPQLIIFLAAGAGLGGLISGGWILWNILSGLPYSHSRQLEQRLGLPVIADWTESRNLATPGNSTRLLQFFVGNQAKTIQISAPQLNGVGESVATSVAQTAATDGRKCLLIAVKPEAGEPRVEKTAFENFFRLDVTPEVAMQRDLFRDGLARLKGEFNLIFVEAGKSNDPAMVNWLSSLVDQDVIVVGKGAASKEVVEECIKRLPPRETSSVALMMVDPRHRKTKSPPAIEPPAAPVRS